MIDKIKLLVLLNLIFFPMFGQFNPQNDEITKKFFPDSELDIHTPSFSKKGETSLCI